MGGWWMSDIYSFLIDEPSLYSMEALEYCELLLINKPSWDQMLEKNTHPGTLLPHTGA
ncbi:MAG: hypothetical protein H7334_01070 [Ferruginibacter sp.]|nr:hypothetical protein [Ferruginibacter sp.]